MIINKMHSREKSSNNSNNIKEGEAIQCLLDKNINQNNLR